MSYDNLTLNPSLRRLKYNRLTYKVTSNQVIRCICSNDDYEVHEWFCEYSPVLAFNKHFMIILQLSFSVWP